MLFLAGGAAVAGAGYYFMSGSSAAQKVESKVRGEPKKLWAGETSGTFVSLKLADVENVNHNTKRFRFELPEEDMVSGLQVASAVLTKYKGPNDEKATLRPYTPINDEGSFLLQLRSVLRKRVMLTMVHRPTGLSGPAHQAVSRWTDEHAHPQHEARPAPRHQGPAPQVRLV